MRKNRVVEQNRCCHLIRRRAHRAFFLTDEGQNRAAALMRRVEGIERNEVDIFSWVRQGDTISEIIDKGGYF